VGDGGTRRDGEEGTVGDGWAGEEDVRDGEIVSE
jgi:hypothetical protein